MRINFTDKSAIDFDSGLNQMIELTHEKWIKLTSKSWHLIYRMNNAFSIVQERPTEKTRLSGYGVELAIKSTEYKAKDDTKVEGTSNPNNCMYLTY